MSSKTTATPENALSKQEIGRAIGGRHAGAARELSRGRDDPPHADLVRLER